MTHSTFITQIFGDWLSGPSLLIADELSPEGWETQSSELPWSRISSGWLLSATPEDDVGTADLRSFLVRLCLPSP